MLVACVLVMVLVLKEDAANMNVVISDKHVVNDERRCQYLISMLLIEACVVVMVAAQGEGNCHQYKGTESLPKQKWSIESSPARSFELWSSTL